MQGKGIVKGNMVPLEAGVCLPDGARVTVTIETEEPAEAKGLSQAALAQRQALIVQMKACGERFAGRHVNLGDLIFEEREEWDRKSTMRQ